ncbi:hypothetical protein THIOSC15_1190003 [uncultured Thiomicrorhabdus sp.]
MAGKGRPTSYKPEYCKLLEDMLSDGKSVIQFAAKLKVARSTVYKWVEDNKEFSDTFHKAKEYSEAYWENELQSMMYSRDVNAPLVKLYFANRFGWSDKKEEAQTVTVKSLQVEFVDPD